MSANDVLAETLGELHIDTSPYTQVQAAESVIRDLDELGWVIVEKGRVS